MNARGFFKKMQDDETRASFDHELLEVVHAADFQMVAVVIDKAVLRERYGEGSAHPYHLGLGFMLQRYAGFLNHINRIGDVMAEARGGKEDLLLKASYTRVYEHGIWRITNAKFFQSALSSKEIKLKSKTANIAGLQLADLLGHPVKMWVLSQYGLIDEVELAPFCRQIMHIVQIKFNRQIYRNKVEGYGYLLYPR